MKIKILFCLLVCFSLCGAGSAQVKKAEPYAVGETLNYEVKFSRSVLRGIEIADINFTVEKATDDGDFLIKSDAKSKGTLAGLFNIKFNINLQSTVDDQKFQVLKTVKRDEQGDRLRLSEAVFDYRAKKVVYSETDPKDEARPPRRVASPIEADTQDLISAIYALRRLPLAVGKTFELKVSDSGLVYKIPVRVVAREMQKTAAGKFMCFRLEPEIFGKNRLIEKQGAMLLWISDDARRLPVRSQINYDAGRIEVKIKNSEKRKAKQF